MGQPLSAPATAPANVIHPFPPILTGEKCLTAQWERSACQFSPTLGILFVQEEGFSPAMVKLFFRPFLGGIFFDRELGTSSRLFEFVLRTLAVRERQPQ